ncbi:hypothetical protein DICSQDRAFT_167141 [Dichomitus squalens LYAD-421 SS1]|uniref:uncharacterized protein n=1 Tax=Dichomitus squalens (strain LYAD-421) TaxID=732165 RepID=UPI0004412CCC|nr:uncharacterized protein DICSQDRAFT_167141 [Dichomitus squalens LYAD-421 SS1]EJF64993.1 hypothetical protein DICSQDRAFT_167141 [Dichomitus squalens LYAD-421 SS1]
MDTFLASSEAGFESIEVRINQGKEEERRRQAKCTYCQNESGDALKNCSRCKAARYCDEACQLADFKARHKRECANFVNPPTTSSFLTTPVAGARYPQHPVFAQGHEDGVGCWVSVAGRIDCDLGALSEPVDPAADIEKRQIQMATSSPNNGIDVIRDYKAAPHSLLNLSVLVQNRRKEKGAVLVFGSRAQAVSYGSTADVVLRGTAKGDNIAKFTRDRVRYVAAGVAIDPWDKVPRLQITHINGQEVSAKKSPPPPAIKDAKEGTIALDPGEHAILHLQFRVGDGHRIAKDWEAMTCIESLRLPYALWDGASPPSSLVPSLPLAQAPIPALAEGQQRGRAITAPLDQRAVRAHYADFIEHGEEAYLRSHFGDARADMARTMEGMMTMMGELFLGQVAEAGGTDVLVQRLREMGMGEMADKIGARGRIMAYNYDQNDDDMPTAYSGVKFLREELEKSTDMAVFSASNSEDQLSVLFKDKYEIILERTGYTAYEPVPTIQWTVTLESIATTVWRAFIEKPSTSDPAVNKSAVLACLDYLLAHPFESRTTKAAQA